MAKCIYCGIELTTGDKIDICWQCENQFKEYKLPHLQGWICPRCGVVHSPFVMQCNCPPPYKTFTTGNINQP